MKYIKKNKRFLSFMAWKRIIVFLLLLPLFYLALTLPPKVFQKKEIKAESALVFRTNGGEAVPLALDDEIVYIETAKDLFLLQDESRNDTTFKLCKNIDLSTDTSWHEVVEDYQKGWMPLNSSHLKSGVFDGGGYAIENLTVNRPEAYSGLFSENALKIKNLFLKNAKIENGTSCGILAGINTGSIDNVHTSGKVAANDYAGGLIAQNYGEIDNCSFDGTITGRTAGGLIAVNSGAYTTNSFSRGRVSGQKIGGLISTAYKSFDKATKIEACFSFCELSQLTYDDTVKRTGGFIAIRESGVEIENCLSTNQFPAIAVGDFNGVRELNEDKRMSKDSFSGFDFENNWNWHDDSQTVTQRTIAVSSNTVVIDAIAITIKGDKNYYNHKERAELRIHAFGKPNLGVLEASIDGKEIEFIDGKYSCVVNGQINIEFTAQYLLLVELNQSVQYGALIQAKKYYAFGEPIFLQAVPAKYCKLQSLNASYNGIPLSFINVGDNTFCIDLPEAIAAYDGNSVLYIDAEFEYSPPLRWTDILWICLAVLTIAGLVIILRVQMSIGNMSRQSIRNAAALYKDFAKASALVFIAIIAVLAMILWSLILTNLWIVPKGKILLLVALPLITIGCMFVLRFWCKE